MRIADPYSRDRYRNRNSITEEQLRDVTGASALPMPRDMGERLPGRHIMLDNLAAGISQDELTYLVNKAAMNGVRVKTPSSRFGDEEGVFIRDVDTGIGGY